MFAVIFVILFGFFGTVSRNSFVSSKNICTKAAHTNIIVERASKTEIITYCLKIKPVVVMCCLLYTNLTGYFK